MAHTIYSHISLERSQSPRESGKYGLALCPKEERTDISGQLLVSAMQSIYTIQDSHPSEQVHLIKDYQILL